MPSEPRHTRCVECGKPRRRPAKGHRSAIDAWLIDRFCSTECAKQFHGVHMRPSDLAFEGRA